MLQTTIVMWHDDKNLLYCLLLQIILFLSLTKEETFTISIWCGDADIIQLFTRKKSHPSYFNICTWSKKCWTVLSWIFLNWINVCTVFYGVVCYIIAVVGCYCTHVNNVVLYMARYLAQWKLLITWCVVLFFFFFFSIYWLTRLNVTWTQNPAQCPQASIVWMVRYLHHSPAGV